MLALLGVVAVLASALALYFRRLAREQRALLLDVLHHLDALRADLASSGVVASAVPSTEPTTPASPVPRSRPQVVPFDQQMTRALERFEANIRVPPALEKRWLERLAALRASGELTASAALTDEGFDVMARELFHAEADMKDARDEIGPWLDEITKPSAGTPSSMPGSGARHSAPHAPGGSGEDGGAAR
jgi:hypothetical protein